MNHNSAPYFLFPHTLLFEPHYRHLSVLLPQLSILQVARPPARPEWGKEQFPLRPVLEEAEEMEQVKLYLQAYQNLADLHGGEGVLASLTQHWTKNDSMHESRFRIQSLLKGHGAPLEKQTAQWLFLEAAVFMELARDLDEKEWDMELSVSRLDQLEEEFREVLGISNEDELEEVLDTTNLPLAADQGQFSFMLSKRIACWYRLTAPRWPEPSPCLVAVTEEVIGEILDPIQTERERSQKTLESLRVNLATIPSLRSLSAETFLILRQELETSDILASYRQDLQKVTEKPDDSSSREALTTSAKNVSTCMDLFFEKNDIPRQGQISLELLHLKDCTHNDLWRKLDKVGYEELEITLPVPETTSLLYLKSS